MTCTLDAVDVRRGLIGFLVGWWRRDDLVRGSSRCVLQTFLVVGGSAQTSEEVCGSSRLRRGRAG